MWPIAEVEFEIDERPVPVVTQELAASDGPGVSDFLGQLTALMAENEKLAVTTRLLEREKGESDEMPSFVKRVLPVLDGFERILEMGREHAEDAAIMNWLQSLESLYYRFRNLLEKYGLFGVEAVGQPVNLDLHEVVEYRYSPDHEPDTVIAVRQRGYVFRGRLLRDAQVVVARDERS
jgi:molecular chaperone GrpE (heat shock protein)